tara:strand:- start:59 stop:736 length:678 start_codon:yes stop_codon:yes gene_type:complete
METYLYFRKFRPATFTHTATAGTQNFTITGLGNDDIDSVTEIASVVVTAGDGANANIGSAYAAVTTTGDTTSLTIPGAIDNTAVNNSVVTIALMNGGGGTEDTVNGYNLETGDTVTVTLQQGLETSVMYPASRLIGIEATATGQTTLRFESLKNNDTEDAITIDHDNGKYEDIVNGINSIINGNKFSVKDNAVTVIDGSGGGLVLSPELKGLGIDGLTFDPESGY